MNVELLTDDGTVIQVTNAKYHQRGDDSVAVVGYTDSGGEVRSIFDNVEVQYAGPGHSQRPDVTMSTISGGL